jgi:predicted phosphodiesterase
VSGGSLRILAVGDTEDRYLWDYYEPGVLDGYDLILSAGDLDPRYLSFLATFARCPVLYVRGNHDDRYDRIPPEGCLCIEDTLFQYRGLRILGLGGSVRYRPGPCQYTQREMQTRIKRQRFALWRAGGCDILLTHAPAMGIHDGSDPAHRGFSCYVDFLKKYHPAYFIHSHIHPSYQDGFVRSDQFDDVRVINAYGKYVLEMPLPNAGNNRRPPWEEARKKRGGMRRPGQYEP